MAVFELLKSLYDLYIQRQPADQRKLLNLLLLNCELRSGVITATFSKPFDSLAEIAKARNDDGAESRVETRAVRYGGRSWI